MLRLASAKIAARVVHKRHCIGVLSTVHSALELKSVSLARTLATNSTIQEGAIASKTSVEATLDKLFENQSASNNAADIVAQASWDPSYTNVADCAIIVINTFRDVSGLGYAESIVFVTVMVRVVLFPLFVKIQRNTARIAHMQPEMQALKKQLDALGNNADQETQMRYGLQMKALFKKYDCNPFSSLIGPLVQLPVFMGMFFGLRKMPDYFGSPMSVEGMLWFSDLTTFDPYYVLPTLTGITMLASVEFNKHQMVHTNPQHGRLMINAFRSMSIVMVPMISQFPSSLTLYWVINNTITAAQVMAFNNQKVRQALKIWEMPKSVPGIPQAEGIVETIRNTVQRKPSESEMMTLHNENVENKKKLAGLVHNSAGKSGSSQRHKKKKFRTDK